MVWIKEPIIDKMISPLFRAAASEIGIDRDDRARSSGEQSIVMPTISVDEAPAAKRGISEIGRAHV